MPLIWKGSFLCMRIRICPSCGAPNGPIVLWLENLLEDGGRVCAQELLGHKADLIMYWRFTLAIFCSIDCVEAQTISVPRRRYGKLQAIREKVSQAHSQPIILSSLILTPEQPMLPLFVQLAKVQIIKNSKIMYFVLHPLLSNATFCQLKIFQFI